MPPLKYIFGIVAAAILAYCAIMGTAGWAILMVYPIVIAAAIAFAFAGAYQIGRATEKPILYGMLIASPAFAKLADGLHQLLTRGAWNPAVMSLLRLSLAYGITLASIAMFVIAEQRGASKTATRPALAVCGVGLALTTYSLANNLIGTQFPSGEAFRTFTTYFAWVSTFTKYAGVGLAVCYLSYKLKLEPWISLVALTVSGLVLWHQIKVTIAVANKQLMIGDGWFWMQPVIYLFLGLAMVRMGVLMRERRDLPQP